MFRRLADRVNDAVTNAASSLSNNNDNSNSNSNVDGSSSDARVSELASMGFREADAMHALRVCDGDTNRAAGWLLANAAGTTAGNPASLPETPPGSTATTRTTTTRTPDEDDSELQRAIRASLATAEQEQTRQATRKRNQQSAASRKAGRAAALRTGNARAATEARGGTRDLAKTHPGVQVPKRLSQHDQEDVILRCANRVAPYSLPVDTLLRSLKTIQGDPSNRKYHTVDSSTTMFRRSLSAPGVLDFLKAVNFHPNYDNPKTMALSHFDAAAFYLGISALEQTQQNSPEYARDKALRVFQKDLAAAISPGNTTTEEISARREFLSGLPSEPTTGGSQITVEYGVVLNNAAATDTSSNNNSSNGNSNSNNSSNSNNNGTVLAVWMPNRSGDRRNPRCCQRLARRLPCTGSGGNRPARAGLYPYAPSNRSRWCPFLPRGSPLALASLLAILFLVAGFPSVLEAPNALADRASAGGRVPSLASGRITVPDGTGGSLSVAYYHQPSGTESTSTSDLVLLHGAAFTRENWKSSGILDLLRDGFSSVSVTALDLPVSADYRTLASVLETLGEQKIVASLPVAGLVTPSASGKAITSWIKQARKSGAGEELPLSDLPSYVRTWIPVASYSVGSCTASDLEALGGLLRSSPAAKPFGILAVYGTKDKRGKTVTETLRDRAGAKTLELTGRHPVYLDSPEEFAEAIGNEVLSRH